MKTNIIESEALRIAQEYHQKYKLAGVIHDDIDKSVEFYEAFYDFKGYAWLVVSDLRPNNFEGSDVHTYVISDEKAEVQYVLDHNGITTTPHIPGEELTDEEYDEIFGDDDEDE